MAIPEALVFDLDGTLIDSRLDIAAALNHALGKSGREALSVETVSGYVGDGSRTLCARATGLREDDPALEELLADFLVYYREHAAEHSRLFPDAREVLDRLSEYPLALCTNKPRPVTDAVLSALGISDLFSSIMAGGDIAEKKPDPAPLFAIAEELGLSPNGLVMIGDGPQDIEAGRRAGARTIGIRGGFPPVETLIAAKPDALIDSLADLPKLIEDWRQPSG